MKTSAGARSARVQAANGINKRNGFRIRLVHYVSWRAHIARSATIGCSWKRRRFIADSLERPFAVLEVSGLIQSGATVKNPVRDPMDHLLNGNARIPKEAVAELTIAQ